MDIALGVFVVGIIAVAVIGFLYLVVLGAAFNRG